MKKIIKKIHLYLAIVLCLPLILQGLSGSILVFEKEVSNLSLRKKNIFFEGKNHEISEIISAAQKEIPENFSPNFIKIDEAATIRFSKKTDEKTSMLEVKIDPASLEILQIKNPETDFFRIVKKFHTNLLIQGEIAHNIVGSFGLVLLFMAISGLILWWPKAKISGESLRRALTFKFSSKGKKFHRDLHGAIGFWTSIFLLIVSFSGVYLAFPQATSKVVLSTFSGQDFRSINNSIKVEPTKDSLQIDDAINLAKNSVTAEEKFISANFPTKNSQPYRINFAPKNYHDGEPMITIFVDQYQKKIIEKRDPSFYTNGEKIIAWQHALHSGDAFGLIWKITVFLVGLLPLVFSITGIALWIMKRKKT